MNPRTNKTIPPDSQSAPSHAMPSDYGSAPDVVRVWLLGGFRVSVGSRAVGQDAWRLRKAAALVKLLALAPGHRLHREQAAEALWPNLEFLAASNNLRQALHVARRTLEPDPAMASRYLSLSGERLALCSEGQLWVDVEAFEEAADTALRSEDPSAYRPAIELYSGELLPEDRYEEWAEGRRRALGQTFLSLLVELVGLYEERGAENEDMALSVQALQRLLAEEPSNEEAHVGLMRLYALSGRQGEALRQYERLSETLFGGLGVEPSASARALREEIAAGRFSARRNQIAGSPMGETARGGVSVGRNNLPAQRDSLVGRGREILEVKRALAMTRLLTLTGTGGSGKTRLALEVARDLVGAYPDGVWLVELASLSEGKFVPQAVAKVVGVPEQPERPLADALVEALRAKEMLLVLDNCEHLVEAAAGLVDVLLDSCPRLRVLATSREALGVAGESRWPVPALSVPGLPLSPTVVELEGSESARLFAERARHRDPTFTVGSENVRVVAEICRRLEGMPLAIELAAARVGTLSLEQIFERLEDSLKLLTAGDRTAVPRQRTLRGALDWSHELLGEPERRLFMQLSVFAGGWTLEAAEVVASDVEADDVLELLSGLANKSLVVSEPIGDGRLRYRLLEPVRQYAQEKLEENGNAEAVRSRHAEYFLTLAEEAEPKLWGPEEAAWLERLEAEHDNLRAALSWALERREAEPALRLAGALWRFWITRGYYEEGKRWCEGALGKGERAAAQAQVLAGLGHFALWQGDLGRAETVAQEGIKLSKEVGIKSVIAADFLIIQGDALRTRGDNKRAKELLEAALVLSREAEDRRGIAWSLGSLANVSSSQGDHERAKELYEEGLALSRELGGAETISAQLLSLGYEFLLEGDHERAAALNEEAATLLRNRGYRTGLEHALDNLGGAALMRGDYERAAELFEESVVLCKELGDKSTAAESLEGLACVAAAKGETERAARLFGAAQELYKGGGYHHTPRERALREPYLADARSRLDGAVWETMFKEGRAMTLEETIEYALSEEKDIGPSSPTPEQSRSEQPAALTRREEEVAGLVARGLTNRQIASDLHLSERTVENHVSNILRKLGRTSRTEIASWATQQSLLAPNPD